ncbi:Nitrite reductase [NAD(P)H] [compost metagenome]
MQYYRETGKYLERTSEWVERLGLEHIRAAIVEDEANRKALMERIEFALEQVEDPWKKVLNDERTQSALYNQLDPALLQK